MFVYAVFWLLNLDLLYSHALDTCQTTNGCKRLENLMGWKLNVIKNTQINHSQ